MMEVGPKIYLILISWWEVLLRPPDEVGRAGAQFGGHTVDGGDDQVVQGLQPRPRPSQAVKSFFVWTSSFIHLKGLGI